MKCHTLFFFISVPNYVSLHSNSMLLSLNLDMFDQLGITIGNFVLELPTGSSHEHPIVESIFGNLKKILEALIGHSKRTQQIID